MQISELLVQRLAPRAVLCHCIVGTARERHSKEAVFLQALPKIMRKSSKRLGEEQSENSLPFNKIISSFFYAFLWDCRSSAEQSAKWTAEHPPVHSALTC